MLNYQRVNETNLLVLQGINGIIYIHQLRIYFCAGYLADWPCISDGIVIPSNHF